MDERIEQAAAYMQEHCAEPLPVEALARLACMSPYHFQRRFKEETGLTAHQYLNHLAAVFKAMTGQAPRDYRRRL